MIVVGLDISTTTGFAAWDTERHESAIVAKTLRTNPKIVLPNGQEQSLTQWEQSCRLQSLVRSEVKRLGRVDVAVIETPQQRAEPSVQTTILLNMLASGAYRALRICGLSEGGIEFIADKTWRRKLYGFGLRKGWRSADWKRHAKATCRQMGIQVANQDEAEGALLAFYAGRVAQAGKYRKRQAETC